MEDTLKKLGDRIRNIRKERGYSQEQLGELSGLHTNYIGQIERGEKNITLESLVKVVTGLGVTLGQLFRQIGPTIEEHDELSEIIHLLSERTSSDHALVLELIKTVFNWEKDKKGN